MTTEKHFGLLDFDSNKKQSRIHTESSPQPVLRLVVVNDETDALFGLPRRYDQSTSGLVSSTGTSPSLSRSSAIEVDSAIRSFLESALRRYPMVVPARSAYSVCWEGVRDLRYLRSDSMVETLPDSNVLTIPFCHLLNGKDPYHDEMDRDERKKLRKRRLRLLIGEIGSQKSLAEILGCEPNYISQLLRPEKPFTADKAREIEQKTRKPEGWLETTDEEGLVERPTEWPFNFDRALWDRLRPDQKYKIEESFLHLVLGASLQEAASTHRRPKPMPAKSLK